MWKHSYGVWNNRVRKMPSLHGEVADKRIPVTREVWKGLSDLKRPGRTFAQLLEEMIENEKKLRLFIHMEQIERKDEFVELPL